MRRKKPQQREAMRYKLIRLTDTGWTEIGTESESADEIYELLEIAQKIEPHERYIVLDSESALHH